jgi:hypothetical protein
MSAANVFVISAAVSLSSIFGSSSAYAACDQYSPQELHALSTQYQYEIYNAARNQHLNPNLIKAVITAESCFREQARSNKGAGGLMQLMPGTARRFGVADRFDSVENIEGGARYLRWLLNRYGGSVTHAIAAYNAGEGRVDVYGTAVPFQETQTYTRRVLNAYNKLSGNYRPQPQRPQGVRVVYQPAINRNNQARAYLASYQHPNNTIIATKAEMDACEVKSRTLYTATGFDTIQSVARRYGMDAKYLARLNGIGAPFQLERGQRLRVEVCQRAGDNTNAAASGRTIAQISSANQVQKDGRWGWEF